MERRRKIAITLSALFVIIILVLVSSFIYSMVSIRPPPENKIPCIFEVDLDHPNNISFIVVKVNDIYFLENLTIKFREAGVYLHSLDVIDFFYNDKWYYWTVFFVALLSIIGVARWIADGRNPLSAFRPYDL